MDLKVTLEVLEAQKQAVKLLTPEGGSVGIGENDMGQTTVFVYFMEWPDNKIVLPDNFNGIPIVYTRIGEVKAL